MVREFTRLRGGAIAEGERVWGLGSGVWSELEGEGVRGWEFACKYWRE